MGCCDSKETPHEKSDSAIRPGLFVTTKKGPLINFYDIDKQLGEGGFGKVFLVKDKRTKLARAVKELKKSVIELEDSEAILKEIEILKSLDHPNIMKVYEVIESPKHYYIVSEYLSGGEVFERIAEQKTLSENLAARILKDCMNAVSYLHANGVVHRDLKPENLMFSNKDENSPVKIIDFGISLKATKNEKLTQKIGTLYFLAPEVVRGQYDYRCDIWSCGVILYILLSGRPPFYGKNQKAIMSSIVQDDLKFDPEEWTNISQEAKDLVTGMLRKDPKKRITVSNVLNHPWIASNASEEAPEKPIVTQSLNNLSKFRAQSKLEKSILTFISSQVVSNEEKEHLSRIFKSLDENKDGKLSKQELKKGYKELGLETLEDIEEIMKKCDIDSSGYIDYTEFVTACGNWKFEADSMYLKQAFNTYDQGGDGNLSINELRKAIPGIEDSEWDAFLAEADTDGDGFVSFDEFRQFLERSN